MTNAKSYQLAKILIEEGGPSLLKALSNSSEEELMFVDLTKFQTKVSNKQLQPGAHEEVTKRVKDTIEFAQNNGCNITLFLSRQFISCLNY